MGCDFIKFDFSYADLPKAGYPQWAEIAGVSQGIARSGRPMVLSLSPGRNITASDVKRSIRSGDGQMYRVTPDFWDTWAQVAYALEWVPQFLSLSGPGHWPDFDMLPFGRIGPASGGHMPVCEPPPPPFACARHARLSHRQASARPRNATDPPGSRGTFAAAPAKGRTR